MLNVHQPSDSFRIGIVVPIYVAEFQRHRVYLANASIFWNDTAELMRKYTTLRSADETVK